MDNRIGRWIRVGRSNRRRFHYIESAINDVLVTYCGRELDSTQADHFVDLGSMPETGIRCKTCDRKVTPVQPMPDQPTAV
jgi:hypothetical protein